ncbi:MAG: VIT domain-containing protein [Desulfatirhabdiaceae bacterium]
MYRETAAGLDHSDCVLQSVSIQADLHETLARVSTTHQYINSGTANIEAVYTFPLSIDAVLLDMNLVVAGRSPENELQAGRYGGYSADYRWRGLSNRWRDSTGCQIETPYFPYWRGQCSG